MDNTLEHGPYHEVWSIYPVILHWRKLTFPFANGYQAYSFWAREASPCPFTPLSVGCHLAWTCAGAVHAATDSPNPYVHQSCQIQKKMIHQSHLPPLSLRIFLPCPPIRSLILEGRGLMRTSVLAPSIPRPHPLCTSSSGCESLVFLTLGTFFPWAN